MWILIVQHLFVVVPALATLGVVFDRLFIAPRRRRPDEALPLRTRGAVIRWPRTYNLIMRFALQGKEQEVRQMVADLAQL